MALTHCIALEQEIPGLDTGMDGKALAIADLEDAGGTTTLSAIARSLNAIPLVEFFSGSRAEILEMLGDDPGNPPEETSAQISPEIWYTPEAGLKTIQTLIPFLQAHPDAVPDSAGVLADLEDAERILTAAQTHNIRWHLAVGGVNEIVDTSLSDETSCRT